MHCLVSIIAGGELANLSAEFASIRESDQGCKFGSEKPPDRIFFSLPRAPFALYVLYAFRFLLRSYMMSDFNVRTAWSLQLGIRQCSAFALLAANISPTPNPIKLALTKRIYQIFFCLLLLPSSVLCSIPLGFSQMIASFPKDCSVLLQFNPIFTVIGSKLKRSASPILPSASLCLNRLSDKIWWRIVRWKWSESGPNEIYFGEYFHEIILIRIFTKLPFEVGKRKSGPFI